MTAQHGKDDAPSAPGSSPGTTADFGFQDVPEAEKEGLVRDVFDSVARRYDLMNDLMSGGLHRLWKATMVDRLRPRAGMKVVDVAGGTGDIAFRILNRAPGASVHVVDINAEMLGVGRDRAIDRGLLHGIDWTCASAEDLPLPDASVDAYTIAFGLRNVTHRDKALAEARRVLRPGGHFLCLEFSRFALPVLGRIYDRYSFTVVPWLGQIVGRDREAYRYLVESIRRFPDQETMVEMMTAAGLSRAGYLNMSGGVVALHSGWRI